MSKMSCLYIKHDLVDRVLVKRKGLRGNIRLYRVYIYDHVYDWGLDEDTREQVLTRDGIEICRTSGWDSGLPCCFARNFIEIAGTKEKSYTVVASLYGAKWWPLYKEPEEIEEA